MYYLISIDNQGFDSLDELTKYACSGESAPRLDVSKYIVVKGTAKRLVQQFSLQPLDAKPAPAKRDKDADAAMRAAVLDVARAALGPITVAEVAKLCNISTADVSRHKAALVKEGLVGGGKGKLEAKRTEAAA